MTTLAAWAGTAIMSGDAIAALCRRRSSEERDGVENMENTEES